MRDRCRRPPVAGTIARPGASPGTPPPSQRRRVWSGRRYAPRPRSAPTRARPAAGTCRSARPPARPGRRCGPTSHLAALVAPLRDLPGGPGPVLHLGHILAVLAHVELVTLHRAPVTVGRLLYFVVEARNAADRIQRQLISVETVEHNHVERCRCRSLFS